ncbi:MAG: hypothetical protein F6K35_46305 [Okeania sp. SIO2H7]|nr:hypothetical protein [Okeania sp. SIO2H7]
MKQACIDKPTIKNPLSRFVTEEAIAHYLHLKTEEIYKIDCWAYIVHVVGKRTSIFVSYADLPPILGVSSPTKKDFNKWRKRLRTRKTNYAPSFWEAFYCEELEKSQSLGKIVSWENLISQLKHLISQESLQQIERVLAAEKARLEKQNKGKN